MIEFPSAAADRAVLAALEEDAAACDLTTQRSVPDGLVSEATIISRAHGIIDGLQMVDLVMHHIDPSVSISLASPTATPRNQETYWFSRSSQRRVHRLRSGARGGVSGSGRQPGSAQTVPPRNMSCCPSDSPCRCLTMPHSNWAHRLASQR